MPDDIRVQDEQGTIHVFPGESTPEMISKAMNVKPPSPAPQPVGASQATGLSAAPKPFTYPWLKGKAINAIDAVSNSLPAAGAMAGGVAGFGAGGPFGSVGGAGIGGMGGEAGKQLIQHLMGFSDVAPKSTNEAANRITGQGVTQAGVQGISEALPFLAGPLQRAATSQYERALAPTTKVNKAITQKIAPEMVDRGLYGKLGTLESKAGTEAANVKPQLDAAYAATPASATAGSGTKILQDLEGLKGKYIVNGQPANPQAVNAISGVQDIVKQYGPDVSPDSLRKLKSIFDEPVAQRGGYGGGDLTTAYTLKAQKAAANSIRGIMGQANPDVAALNKELTFWLNVQKVTSQSGLRKTGQEGLIRGLGLPFLATTGGEMLGRTAGVHGGEGAAVGLLTTAAAMAVRTPAWRTASAVLKDRFADALARGSVGDVTAVLARLGIAAQELPQVPQQSAPKIPNQ